MSKKIAMVFPGQGSQAIGMLKELALTFPSVIETFREASEVLNYDLWKLIQEGPVEIINQTAHTQPALLTASVALWRVWCDHQNQQPSLLAGHSLGEYSALVCAQSINFTDAVKLVAERGRFMQEAVPEGQGAMAALVGLDNKQVEEICAQAAQGKILAPANYNALSQVVIAGESEAVNRAIHLAQQAGAKLAKRLPVSVPSHCALMQVAAERLSAFLQNISCVVPIIPIVNNVDVITQKNPGLIKDALIRQLYNPVRWVEIIQVMASQGIEIIIECGPGKVLAGLNKRILPAIPTLNINDLASLNQALTEVNN